MAHEIEEKEKKKKGERNLYITKSWSVAFNVAMLPLTHVNSHVIINFFPIFLHNFLTFEVN